jgi:hypothetical protein
LCLQPGTVTLGCIWNHTERFFDRWGVFCKFWIYTCRFVRSVHIRVQMEFLPLDNEGREVVPLIRIRTGCYCQGRGSSFFARSARRLPLLSATLGILTCLAIVVMATTDLWPRAQLGNVPMLIEADRLDLIPGSEGLASNHLLGGNNQIVRQNDSWTIVFDGADGQIWMSTSSLKDPEGRNFQRAFPLVGENHAVLSTADPVRDGNLLLDRAGRLHLFWLGQGLHHAVCETSCLGSPNRLASATDWTIDSEATAQIPHISELGDVWIDRSGNFWICFTNEGEVYVAGSTKGSWVSKPVTRGYDPSAFLDTQGTLHLVFEHGRRIQYVQVNTSSLDFSPIEDVAYGLLFYPRITVVSGRPLVVYQVEGVKGNNIPLADPGGPGYRRDDFILPLTEGRPPGYNELREGAGASIAYAVAESGHWRRGFVAHAEEIPVRMASLNSTNSGEVRPMVEELWHPVISVDRHGVPWVFWSNTTRLHTYFARWLGSGFSGPLECRGPLYDLSWALSSERHSSPDASSLGVLTVASRRLYFDRVIVPPVESRQVHTFPVFDLLEFADVFGLDLHLGEFTRYEGNPIFGGPGRPTKENATFPNAWFDGRKFLMEFTHAEAPSASDASPVQTGESVPVSVGRWASRQWLTTSEDGLHWTTPQRDLYRYIGPTAGEPPDWVTYFRDDAELDASRRFKGILGAGNWISNDSRRVVYSSDGRNWRDGGVAVNAQFLMEEGGPSYRDPYDIDERRFKSICRSLGFFGNRALGIMYSSDVVEWKGAEPRLMPELPYAGPRTTPQFWRGRLLPRLILDSLGERWGEQVYWGTVWIENGIYMCLYASMPYDGGYDVSLAASRDGLHFYRIKNGERVLPRGVGGDWDSASIASTSVPIPHGDELWYYYGGRMRHHGVEKYNLEEFDGIGLAKMRRDGWGYLQISDSGMTNAYATTVPLYGRDLSGRELFLNLDGAGPGGGSVRVEVLDGDSGQPLPGLGGSSGALVRSSGTSVPVLWSQGSSLGRLSSRRVQIRFHVEGLGVKLYSFTIK